MNTQSLPSDFSRFLKWATEAIQEGDAFLKSQSGYELFADTIAAINGEYIGSEARPSTLLQSVTYNYMGKVALDMVAAQTDIKPFWDYKTYNHKFEQQAQIANKLATAWWMGRHVTLRFSDVIKHCLPMGSGYAHLVYNPQSNGFGGGYQGGDIELIPEDPRDVLPIRPGSFLSIQECAGIVIRRERSVNWIRAKYGAAAQGVKADRDASLAQLNKATRFSRLMGTLGLRSGFMDNLFSSLSGKPQAAPLNVPSADLYTLYYNDDSINTTGSGRWMGLEPNTGEQTNWSYYVPSVGELNKTSGRAYKDDDPDVRFYPRKRCVIFTKSCRIYDDTSIYWHGMFPLAKLTLDPWPSLWLGKAPLKDLMPLHTEMQKVMRIFSQHAARIRRPGIAADKNAVSKEAMARIDPEREGLKIRTNPVAGGKPIEMLYEPALDPFMERYFLMLKEGMQELSGNLDPSPITDLGQVPQLETMDRLIAAMAATNRLRSQVIEAFMSEFAMMLLMNFFQFYTQAQRIAILGNQGQTWEDFDYDPGNLIPDMLDMGMRAPDGSVLPRYDRAREFYRYFTYQIAPGSLLNSASLQDKMMYMVLARSGAIDIASLLEKLNIPNLGLPEDFPPGILQRLQWQQQNGIGLAVSPQGRKASGEQAPRMKMSESG